MVVYAKRRRVYGVYIYMDYISVATITLLGLFTKIGLFNNSCDELYLYVSNVYTAVQK